MARIICELPGGENCFSEDGELQGFRITDKPQQQRSEEKGLGRAARGQVETIVNEGRGGHHCAPPVQKCQLRKHLCTRDSLPNGISIITSQTPLRAAGKVIKKAQCTETRPLARWLSLKQLPGITRLRRHEEAAVSVQHGRKHPSRLKGTRGLLCKELSGAINLKALVPQRTEEGCTFGHPEAVCLIKEFPPVILPGAVLSTNFRGTEKSLNDSRINSINSE